MLVLLTTKASLTGISIPIGIRSCSKTHQTRQGILGRIRATKATVEYSTGYVSADVIYLRARATVWIQCEYAGGARTIDGSRD